MSTAALSGSGTAPPTSATALPLAVYGTLLDAEVRRLVLGPCRGRPARLSGWERVYVAGQVYPGIRPSPGAMIDVLVLPGLSRQALAMADLFEGDDYTREPLALTYADDGSAGQAMLYVPTPAIRLSDKPWRYDAAWRNAYRARFLSMARAALANARTVVR